MLSLQTLFSKVRWSRMIGSSLPVAGRSVQQDVLYFAVQEIWIDKTEWNKKMKATSDKHFHTGDIILLQITYMRCVIASAE